MDGIINILKPPGMTSFDVIAAARRHLGAKAGHCGTLDPAAAGVLPVCAGKATRLIEYIESTEKTYVAELTLGIVTDTYDSEGTVTEVRKASVGERELTSALEHFRGDIDQVPPMYSAIKVAGRRLYDIARAGGQAELKARRITIYELALNDYDASAGKAILKIRCSKGTYIRSLCHDIGRVLGCGGHMSFLVRTAAGSFRIEDAQPIGDIAAGREPALMSMEKALGGFTAVTLTENAIAAFLNGKPVDRTGFTKTTQDVETEPGHIAAVYGPDGRLIGLAIHEENSNGGTYRLKAGKLLI